MKMVKKVLFWIVTAGAVMFITCWVMSTASRMHVGEKFPAALYAGFVETADGAGELFGVAPTAKPDLILDFTNGRVGFGNTHISWK